MDNKDRALLETVRHQKAKLLQLEAWVGTMAIIVAVLALLVGGLSLIRNFWPRVGRFAERVVDYMSLRIIIPVWVLVPAGVLLGVGAVHGWRFIARRYGANRHLGRFRSTTLSGVSWRWGYDGAGDPVALMACCPDCTGELEVTHKAGAYCAAPQVSWLGCPACNKDIRRLNKDFDDIVAEAREHIRQSIVTGEWQG